MSEKYLKIAYLTIVGLLLRIRRRHPPPIRSQRHTLPLLKIFIFFIFFSTTLSGIVFTSFLWSLSCIAVWFGCRLLDV